MNGPPLKLLVVEDKQTDFDLLQRVLDRQCIDASCLRVSADAALQDALAGQSWDVALMDYRVPGMEFDRTVATLKQCDPFLPVILFSGTLGEEEAAAMLCNGLNDYIQKDHPARMASAIRNAIEYARTARDAFVREAEFRILFEGSPTGILVVDAASERVLEASPRALSMFGYSLDEIRKLSIAELTAPEDRDSTQVHHAALQTGSVPDFTVEKRYQRKDGSQFWAEVVASLLPDAAGRPSRGIANILDITERKEAQAKARLWLEAFERSDLCFAISDANSNRLVDVNPAFAARRGYTVEEMRRMTVDQLFAPGSTPAYHDSDIGIDSKAHVIFESEHICKDGSTFPVWVDLTVIADSRGRAMTRVACAFDITERRRAEAELLIAATAFEVQDGIIITDSHGIIERVNHAFTRITGYSPEEALGHKPSILRSGRQDGSFYEAMWRQLGERGSWRGELVNRHRNGHLYTERLAIAAVKDHAGIVRHYVGTMSDITAERAAKDRAEHLTYFDPLTELPNRTLLEDRIAHALAMRRRSGEHCALLQIDLDHFKLINDVSGHHVGDLVLAEVAHRLHLLAREGDTAGRFNGDTFMVLVEDLGMDLGHAARFAGAVAEKIRRGLARPFEIDGAPMRCTASIGITLMRNDHATVHDVMQEAEIALYRAKHDGRDRTCMFEQSMQRALQARTALESELHAAVSKQQFVLYYQLQTLGDGAPVGAEALVRWNHPTRGLVLPGDFIALAEETGQIAGIGQWVLDEACRQLGIWATRAATRDLTIAVNVSPKRLRSPDFVQRIVDSLARHAADASRLKVEITEGAIIDDVEDAIMKLEALRRHGVRISLDDFGTGNSSFSYLTRLPLDQIKIDRSFVMNLPESSRDAKTAKAIVALGKELEFDVIAEGVETLEQVSYLRSVGCELFQGFHFARPAPIAEVERRITRPATPTPA